MVLPVTLYTKAIDTPSFYMYKTGRRQKRPYNLVLPYTCNVCRVVSRSTDPTEANTAQDGIEYGSAVSQCRSLAYDKLLSMMSSSASMGENLGQLPSSYRLISESLTSFRRITSAFRRGLFPFQWTQILRQPTRSIPRELATKRLEWAFAVKPSVDDVMSVVEILDNPLKSPRLRGRASNPFTDDSRRTSSPFSKSVIVQGLVRSEYGASVSISNPMLYLANRTGLVNPFVVGWQLLPGSFLVDWLVNVEQYLSTATDFLGLSVESSWTSTHIVGSTSNYWNSYGWSSLFTWSKMQRVSGIDLPPLTLRPLKIPGLGRALNAASLAILATDRHLLPR